MYLGERTSIVPLKGNIDNKNDIDAYPVLFTGSGGEYFRVWLVNVLLNLVTLGLYTPFARRRTAQYFYSNTLVADSPLEFTAQPRKMFVGFMLLIVLSMAFQFASKTGNQQAVNLFLFAAALLAPYVWGNAMRFRLASTRWRGLRFQFTATWPEVYFASWPMFALALIWAVFSMVIVAVLAMTRSGGGSGDGGNGGKMAMSAISPWVAWIAGGMLIAVLILSVLCVIRLSFNYQSLLVKQARIGAQAGRWKPKFADFVHIWLATIGVFIAGTLVIGGLFFSVGASMAWFSEAKSPGLRGMMVIGFMTMGGLLGLLLASAPARAYREARMFNLVWSHVGVSQVGRFKCDLGVGRYVGLRIKNMLLVILTLGFYRAFAKVSEYAMKTESVTLFVKGGVDQLTGEWVKQQGALGDAMADAIGLDLVG